MTAAQVKEQEKWIRLMESVNKGHLTPVIEKRKAELEKMVTVR